LFVAKKGRKASTYHTENCAILVRGEAEATDDATDGRVGGGDEGVGAEIDVQHRCIGSLHEDLLPGLVGLRYAE
jgi:hypothetical protein